MLTALQFKLADLFQLAEHDAVAGATVITLRDGKPDLAIVFVEGRILKRVRRLETVLALPSLTVARDVHVEDAAVAIVNTRVLLPAEVIDAAELVEGRLRVQAAGYKRHRLADAPCLAVFARREVIVARVVATDCHPSAIRQTVHRRLAELLRLRLVIVADDFKGSEVIVQDCECILFAGEVVERHVAATVELFE